MAKTKTSEVIRCPNKDWRLYTRRGVYYACGRKHGYGKHSLSTRDRKQAIEELLQLDSSFASLEKGENQIDGGLVLPTNPSDRDPIAISEGWELYIEKRSIPIHLGGLKPTSIVKYHQHKNRFVTHCKKVGVQDWQSVTQDVLEIYATAIDGSLAPITIHDDLTMEISVSNWLIKKKLIPYDNKINWKLQKPPGAERYCYERDEVSEMLQYTSAFKKNRWLYPTILLLSHTGMRIGEAINFKWPDVDLKREVVHVRDESFMKQDKLVAERRMVKDKESRIIPTHAVLMKYLSACKEKTGHVLTGDRGGKLNYNHCLDAFKNKVIKPLTKKFPTSDGELGFKDGRFHSFRHFFVSECFEAGIPECHIKDWVGHSDSKIVELYRHIRSESAKANMQLGKFGTAETV